MRLLAALALISFAAAGNSGGAAQSPILVELFTSEGCSSCPPADALLEKLDATQPVAGAQLIVLSEHVDYWDHDGWKDPYSSSLLTERQDAYCRALRVDDPYTPQMIVDGTAVLKLSDSRQIGQTFERAAATPKLGVLIRSVRIQPGTSTVLQGHIKTDGAPEKVDAEVYVAAALDHAESQVLRGENSGRHLTHIAVLQSLKKLGKVQSGTGFDQDFQLRLKVGVDASNIRVVAFVQEPDAGKVLGAALQKPPIR